MIRCKHVSDALRDHNWEDLPPKRKFFLRMHVMMCAVCGRFNRQIMKMQSTTREFVNQEEHIGDCCLPKIGSDSIKQAIKDAKKE